VLDAVFMCVVHLKLADIEYVKC